MSLKESLYDLQEAGTVLHLARSGRLIVKAFSQIPDGTLLVDGEGRRSGRVMETIGSVASPYLSVQPMTDRIERVVGDKLFISASQRGEKSVKFSRQEKKKQRTRKAGPDRQRKESH